MKNSMNKESLYMILNWINNDYVTPVVNDDGSIKLFDKLNDADEYANNSGDSEKMRVISVDGVHE